LLLVIRVTIENTDSRKRMLTSQGCEIPMPGSRPTTLPDPAAEHARALLRPFAPTIRIPDRERPPSPAIEWARSGAMALTGRSDGPPRFAAGALASAATGAGMALRALAPCSPLACLDAAALLGERAAIAGLARHGSTSAGGSARLLATREGSLALNLPRDDDWSLVPAWLESEDAAFAVARDWKRLADLVAARRADDLEARGRLMGLAVSRAGASVPRDRPLYRTTNASEARPRAGGERIRVLDLSSLWAGPLATSLLAAAGLDVLKVECPHRPDGARRGPARFFDLLNAGKRGVALDLHAPSDRTTFEGLLEDADVVVDSARPRALAQLGYDAEAWVSDRAGRVWVALTGHGRDHEWIAFGDDAAAAAGLCFSPEPRHADAVFCADAIADPLAGLHGAALVLAHLWSGRGGLVDLALADVAAAAARVAEDDLWCPLASEGGAWSVIGPDGRIGIAAPRARPGGGAAPMLAPPDAALLSEWRAAC
jgi:hypothetical protein